MHKKEFKVIQVDEKVPKVTEATDNFLEILKEYREALLEAKDDSDVRIKEKYLDYEEHNIYYEMRGDSLKTLVFVHGWTSDVGAWKYQLNYFGNYKVIAIDLPGHGKSSKNLNSNYSMGLFADSVNAVLEKENISETFLFGHSMGFSVSEIFALKYSDKCVGIGSIDGAHFEIPNDESGRKEWIDYNRSFAESMNEEKGREDFINALMFSDTPDILREEVFATSRQVPLIIGKNIIASMEGEIEFWSKRVMDIPCFVVHSPAYQLTEDYKRDFMIMYPRAKYYEIKDVSHFLMLEVPYKINQMMLDYLKVIY